MSTEQGDGAQLELSQAADCVIPERKPRFRAVLIAFAAVAVLVGAGLTMAFTAASAPTNNVITFGNVKLKVLETEERADGSFRWVADGDSVHAPTGEASRVVRFQNVGSTDMYVRARPQIRAFDSSGADQGDAVKTVTTLLTDGTGAWELLDDGWFYYTESVAAATDGSDDGEITEPVMTGIEFAANHEVVVGSNGHYELTVMVQAVQASNNGDSWRDAKGWPTEGAQN